MAEWDIKDFLKNGSRHQTSRHPLAAEAAHPWHGVGHVQDNNKPRHAGRVVRAQG